MRQTCSKRTTRANKPVVRGPAHVSSCLGCLRVVNLRCTSWSSSQVAHTKSACTSLRAGCRSYTICTTPSSPAASTSHVRLRMCSFDKTKSKHEVLTARFPFFIATHCLCDAVLLVVMWRRYYNPAAIHYAEPYRYRAAATAVWRWAEGSPLAPPPPVRPVTVRFWSLLPPPPPLPLLLRSLSRSFLSRVCLYVP